MWNTKKRFIICSPTKRYLFWKYTLVTLVQAPIIIVNDIVRIPMMDDGVCRFHVWGQSRHVVASRQSCFAPRCSLSRESIDIVSGCGAQQTAQSDTVQSLMTASAVMNM
jgi:hypothetical protein